MFKNAMVGAAALGLVLASTAASAEPVRATAALPGVVSANKHKIARTAAPAGNESKATWSGATLALAIAAAAAAGVGTYYIVRNDSNGAVVSDTPGG